MGRSRVTNIQFSQEEIKEAKQSMVANPEHLKETLDVVFGNAEYNSAEYLYRTMFWLAFIGFEMQDIVCMKASNIEWDVARIVYSRPNGHLIWGSIPPEAFPDIHQACDLTHMTVSYKVTSRRYKRAEGDNLVRGRQPLDFEDEQKREQYTRRVIRPMFSKAFRDAEARLKDRIGGVPEWISINLTLDRTIKSGVFYRFYERERAGLETNLKNIYQVQYARPEDQDWDYTEFNYQYRRQYALWKEAFTTQENDATDD